VAEKACNITRWILKKTGVAVRNNNDVRSQSMNVQHRTSNVELLVLNLLCFTFNIDDFVKSPTSVLRCIIRHWGVPVSTPHSSGCARLECEAFSRQVLRKPRLVGGDESAQSKNNKI
jgi:hypothetical protein